MIIIQKLKLMLIIGLIIQPLTPYATTATLTNDYLNSTQIATNYYNKSEIDSNNWIDATALTPYATTATLTAKYKK